MCNLYLARPAMRWWEKSVSVKLGIFIVWQLKSKHTTAQSLWFDHLQINQKQESSKCALSCFLFWSVILLQHVNTTSTNSHPHRADVTFLGKPNQKKLSSSWGLLKTFNGHNSSNCLRRQTLFLLHSDLCTSVLWHAPTTWVPPRTESVFLKRSTD